MIGPVARDEATAEFFDGTAAGQFLLRRCPEGHYSEPAAVQCTTCATTELRWAPAGGGASLVSWAVTGRDGGESGTVLVIAELDEGPWWWSQLRGEAGDLAVGRRLRIAFARPGGEEAGREHETVPVFILAPEPGG